MPKNRSASGQLDWFQKHVSLPDHAEPSVLDIIICIVVACLFQFNKLSHNCAGVSVLGVLGEEDVFMEDYQDYRDLDTEPLPGYNKRTHK